MTVRAMKDESPAAELFELTRDYAQRRLAPRVDEAERTATFPRDVFRELGELGLLGLPYAEEYGGADQPASVYLQVLEELGAVWASVAVGVSVHYLACLPMVRFGSEAQKERWLPWMLGGETLGAYCLSEGHAGSDPAAMRTSARLDGDHYVLRGAKAWTTHGGHANFYTVMARTSDQRNGISCFFVPADTPGIRAERPESKLGLTASPTATVHFDEVRIPAQNLIGELGQGLAIALTALDSGRLGIAAVATGLSQACLREALRYAADRETFGRPIIEHQGVGFILADMVAAVETSRAMYLRAAALRDSGEEFSREASIAKLVATDNAMQVAIDAVQVLGGAGYTKDFSVERFMREAKVMQIFEGTNQIQRLIISRHLGRHGSDPAGKRTVT